MKLGALQILGGIGDLKAERAAILAQYQVPTEPFSAHSGAPASLTLTPILSTAP